MTWLCLFLAAVCASFIGLERKPLSTHEIFVVQTAEEMQARGEWVVPYYNDELRLTKPPLSYWLTRLTADAINGGQIEAIHGRIPSALAGCLFVMATAWMGARLWSQGVGLLGGALTLCSIGFIHYARNARPEMVYAALSAVALALIIEAWKRPAPRKRWMPYAAWLCLGLATLAKGPHIPAMLVAGLAVAISRQDGWRVAIKSIRPIAGSVLLLAVALPWMWLLRSRVADFAQVAPELEGGRYLLDIRNILDPFYFYRPLRLALPWAPLVFGSLGLAHRQTPQRDNIRALFWVMLVVILGMSFGGLKRDYYMLPLLGLYALLASVAVMDSLQRAGCTAPSTTATSPLRRMWEAAPPVVITLILAVSLTLGHEKITPATLWPAVGAALLLGAGALAKNRALRANAWLLALGVSVGAIGLNQALVSAERQTRADAGRAVRQWVPRGQPIHCYVDPAFSIYYGKRHAINRTNPSPLLAPPQPGEWILWPQPAPPDRTYPKTQPPVAVIQNCDDGTTWLLAQTAP